MPPVGAPMKAEDESDDAAGGKPSKLGLMLGFDVVVWEFELVVSPGLAEVNGCGVNPVLHS